MLDFSAPERILGDHAPPAVRGSATSYDELVERLLSVAPVGTQSIAFADSPTRGISIAIAAARALDPARQRVLVESGLTPACTPEFRIEIVASLIESLAEPSVAAVIVEPAIRTNLGMSIAIPGALRALRDACAEHGVMMIADETIVGTGRSGFLWACTRDAVAPDLLVAGSALTAGAMPFAAVMASGPCAQTLRTDHAPGHANDPQAIATADAVLQMLHEGNFLGESRRKASDLTELLAPLEAHPSITGVRQRGLIAGIVFRQELEARRAHAAIAAADLRLGLAGFVLALYPPLTIDDAALLEAVGTLEFAIRRS